MANDEYIVFYLGTRKSLGDQFFTWNNTHCTEGSTFLYSLDTNYKFLDTPMLANVHKFFKKIGSYK